MRTIWRTTATTGPNSDTITPIGGPTASAIFSVRAMA